MIYRKEVKIPFLKVEYNCTLCVITGNSHLRLRVQTAAECNEFLPAVTEITIEDEVGGNQVVNHCISYIY